MVKDEKPESLSPEELEALLHEIERETEQKENKKDTYVIISEDKMEAWLYLTEPKDGSIYSKSDIIDLLKEQGVMAGFLESNLAAIAKKKIYNREIIIAQGKAILEGVPGRYDYYFNPQNYKAAPRMRADGSVDYQSMSELPNVHKGDELARYYPAVSGEDGYDVTGKILKVGLVRDLPPLRGKGISNAEDKNLYIALMEGKIENKNGTVDIQPIHEIHGDVDLIIGKVEFFGDIIISGNVSTGVIIRAGRNVVISGFVEAVTIYAGGDIILRRGISGGKKAKLIAKGNVLADFIEHTEIEAGGSVSANIIMNSRVVSKDMVIVSGKKGSIIGGYTHGLTGLKATNLGNDIELKTVVHVGYEAGAYERLVYLTRQENDLKKELGELVNSMAEILKSKRLRGNINPLEEKNLVQFNRKKDEIFILLDSTRQERDKLALEVSKGKGAKIHVEGNINRGTVICAEGAQMIMERSTVYMEYSSVSGQIQGNVIIYK